ncbi:MULTISPECIES: DUF6221 family protein [unclassified Streptomyces]|uniref:DUF6221 family protein n=1 Tax=unclassified Streptomyces TaxID=2593676 RepID=UPI00080535B7|nr:MULTISPECIES: DUF6221 family protein [unclassified Streptomyces]MYR76549.1 hypothetical protein [Streptomyces sp. SID4925]SBV00048.1 hypothetical protein YUMDRAFT_06317 [Streptomyces sp. OspMP-M45]
MDNLVQFLRARFYEDTRLAVSARDPWFGYEPDQHVERVREADALHIARHSPKRILAEVDAKRALLTEYEERAATSSPDLVDLGRLQGLEKAIRALTAPYAGHPDYRSEWRP